MTGKKEKKKDENEVERPLKGTEPLSVHFKNSPTVAEFLTPKYDFTGGTYKDTYTVFANLPVIDGSHNIERFVNTSSESGIMGTLDRLQRTEKYSPTSLDNPLIMTPTTKPSFFDLGNVSEYLPRVPRNNLADNLSREDIENLIDKKLPSKNNEGLKEEKVVEIVNEVLKNKNKREEENISMAEKQSFEIMKKMFSEGKTFAWYCRCGYKLDEFKTDGDIEKIKSYLDDFRKGNLKKCQKNGHRNWFELRGGEIVCSESALLDKEFKKPKESGQKLDNSQ